MERITDLATYLALPTEHKWRVNLDRRAAMQMPRAFVSDPMVDITALPGAQVLTFFSTDTSRMVRATMGAKIIAAAQQLQQQGLRVRIGELYRSLSKQRRDFARLREEIRAAQPHLTEQQLWEATTAFSADPDMMPPHCSGGAVDLTLCTPTGELLDMGTGFDAVDEDSFLINDRISPQAQANRKILMDAMLAQGLAPLPTEWWHYSYGDIRWAAYYGAAVLYDVYDDAASSSPST